MRLEASSLNLVSAYIVPKITEIGSSG